MLDAIKMRVMQIGDLARSNGWRSVFKEMVFLHRKAILVEKDLSQIPDRPEMLANLKIVEIDQDLLASGRYDFALNSRKLKACHHLAHGCGGYALVQGNQIIGDTWHWASDSTDPARPLHSDLRRFGFKDWRNDSVYTFDIFVVPAERKTGISAAFQNAAMLSLRAKGFNKGYGFYWADNIAAHWCTRVTNKWTKLREVSVNRFLMFMWADDRAGNKLNQTTHGVPVLPNS
jgi:hypothetical protein